MTLCAVRTTIRHATLATLVLGLASSCCSAQAQPTQPLAPPHECVCPDPEPCSADQGQAGAARGSSATSSQSLSDREVSTALEPLAYLPPVGQMVLARWGEERYFFLGRVAEERNGDEVRIIYLDGDQAWRRLEDLRRDTIQEGSVVHVSVSGREGWSPTQVLGRADDRVEVQLSSLTMLVPLARVRVQEL